MTPKRSGELKLFTGSRTSMGGGQTTLALDGSVDMSRWSSVALSRGVFFEYLFLAVAPFWSNSLPLVDPTVSGIV
ncbi:MAG: hypothetical protein KJ630_03330 [Proteobacteria bacterium]|nr:hypothetical protein [Pseudomonadota bacterium]